MKPIYSGDLRTPVTDAAEEAIVRECGERWGVTPYFVSGRSTVDRYFVDSQQTVVAYAEVKDRSGSSPYPTIYLSVRKFHSLISHAIWEGAHPLFIVRRREGILWLNCWDLPALAPKRLGRQDRGLNNDMEPCFEVPVSAMRRLDTGKPLSPEAEKQRLREKFENA